MPQPSTSVLVTRNTSLVPLVSFTLPCWRSTSLSTLSAPWRSTSSLSFRFNIAISCEDWRSWWHDEECSYFWYALFRLELQRCQNKIKCYASMLTESLLLAVEVISYWKLGLYCTLHSALERQSMDAARKALKYFNASYTWKFIFMGTSNLLCKHVYGNMWDPLFWQVPHVEFKVWSYLKKEFRSIRYSKASMQLVIKLVPQ